MKLPREVARRCFPSLVTTLRSIRARRHSHQLVAREGYGAIDRRIADCTGLEVSGGPFTGLRLPSEALREHLGPFLLGTYESEIHSWLEELRERELRQILDIGAKFGYYAVGLARWFPRAEVLAFDTDPWARKQVRRAALENGTDRVSVRGYLRPAALQGLIRPPALVVSDCEGFEDELFRETDPEAIRECWLLIELHESLAPGVGERLRRRFAETHEIAVRNRSVREVRPEWIQLLGAEGSRRAIDELRGEQQWMFCRPAARRSS